MTSGQRKAHKIIWLTLGIAVPFFMVFTIKDLDFENIKTNDTSITEESSSKPAKTAENELLKAAVYKGHMDIILKSPLKTPSALLYELNKEGSKERLLGQLKAVDIYKFNIADIPNGLLVYDPLKELEITKITF